jgi:hypothetical protein
MSRLSACPNAAYCQMRHAQRGKPLGTRALTYTLVALRNGETGLQ